MTTLRERLEEITKCHCTARYETDAPDRHARWCAVRSRPALLTLIADARNEMEHKIRRAAILAIGEFHLSDHRIIEAVDTAIAAAIRSLGQGDENG